MRITRFLRNRAVTVHEIIAAPTMTTPESPLHPMIAADAADGALQGLVHAEFLRRPGGGPDHRTLTEKG
jgi:hypothetical protein